MVFTYLGPGLGIGTLVVVLLVLLLVLVSLVFIIWIPLKRTFLKIFRRIVK